MIKFKISEAEATCCYIVTGDSGFNRIHWDLHGVWEGRLAKTRFKGSVSVPKLKNRRERSISPFFAPLAIF